ncbi:MAG: ATP-binding protein, partial [Sphingobacteriales bacterium]
MGHIWLSIDLMEKLTGRLGEKKILSDPLDSNETELIAAYGRRRVGKTFLIRSFYQKDIVFELTGIHEASHKDQLQNFSIAFSKYSGRELSMAPANWILAFEWLQQY